MKIVKLEVENLKRVVKVDITPGGLMVLITGPVGVVIEDGQVVKR